MLIHDGPDDKSMLIGELFGTPNHRIVKSISSSKKSMFISFKAQSGVGWNYGTDYVEFIASIIYNKINSDCQSWLKNDELMSPNHPNINCSWIIARKFGSYITLDFSFIEVKPMNIKGFSLI